MFLGLPMNQALKQLIRSSGPISLHRYMRECLTNPQHGYYCKSDVLGQEGDFITSPEISQMFGELVGVWMLHEWQTMRTNKPLRLVEFGPGRGTLASDVLRTFHRLGLNRDDVSYHLVEVSPHYRKMQRDQLCHSSDVGRSKVGHYSIDWSASYEQVFSLGDSSNWTTCYLAHEFFDALPIHVFLRQSLSDAWMELMVDVDEADEGFRFVRSRTVNEVVLNYLPSSVVDRTTHVEICPEVLIIWRRLIKEVAERNSFVLCADYGHLGEKTDTFRAFRKHQLVDPLKYPGQADLTADVNFEHLKLLSANNDGVLFYGPIGQKEFLVNLGIGVRLQMLLRNSRLDSAGRQGLLSACKMLLEDMGERFKFVAVLPKSAVNDQSYLPSGFKSPFT